MNYREFMREFDKMSPAKKEEHRDDLIRILKIRMDEITLNEDKPTIGKLWRQHGIHS